MPDHESLLYLLGLIVVAAPAVLVVVLGVSSLLDWPLGEETTDSWVRATTMTALVAALGVLGLMLGYDTRHVVIDLGNWVEIAPHEPGAERTHYHFDVKFVFDRLSVPFLLMSLVLCGTVGAFAVRYMHRERGYNRFFVLYSLFVLGMVVASLAGTIETLFSGWELVGLSSALLVAYFHERPAPVRNGLRVWVVYRVSDAALLIAAVTVHHLTGEGDFDKLLGAGGVWPEGHTTETESTAVVVGLLIIVAAAGKSALVPFSGWLPRAMEGPTPSSAVFYGALSVHLGAYLLLRVSPLLEVAPVLAVVVIVLGLVTALFAYLAGSVQTDIKSALSFASLAQVGIIVTEIGVGAFVPFLWYVALVHLLGHACLRTLQFLRAPTLLQDYRMLENAIGGRLPRVTGLWVRLIPAGVRAWLYRLALERGYLDSFLVQYVVAPFVRVFEWLDAFERKWTRRLSEEPTPADHRPAEPALPRPAETPEPVHK
jgi:NAD(P)H-quinone oxidoreductase subunit 5